MERSPQFHEFVFGYFRATIFNCQPDVLPIALQMHLDPTARWRVAHCIVKKVGQQFTQHQWASSNIQWLQIKIELNFTTCSQRNKIRHRFPKNSLKSNGGDFIHCVLSVLQFRER